MLLFDGLVPFRAEKNEPGCPWQLRSGSPEGVGHGRGRGDD